MTPPKTVFNTPPISIDSKIPTKKALTPEELKIEQEKYDLENKHISIPKWLHSMDSIDIISLPFSDIPFEHDFYEKAYLQLYKRGIGYTKIFLLHFLIISPLFWLSIFPYVKKISIKTFFIRWPIFFIIPFLLYTGIFFLMIYLKHEQLYIPLATIAIIGYLLIYFITSYEMLIKWRLAYLKMNKNIKAL